MPLKINLFDHLLRLWFLRLVWGIIWFLARRRIHWERERRRGEIVIVAVTVGPISLDCKMIQIPGKELKKLLISWLEFRNQWNCSQFENLLQRLVYILYYKNRNLFKTDKTDKFYELGTINSKWKYRMFWLWGLNK